MNTEMITNPILKGFNPDPSIIRVEDDYYIATSTFEWFPGVQIHRSKDMKHWRLLTHALTRVSQLDLRGNPSSGGIWAPCLSYDKQEKKFYLIYTDVKTTNPLIDFHNYLVTSDNITGPWSDPVYLNSSGFDPSLFHDDDGKKWLVNLQFEYRKGYPHPGPIILQEYSKDEKKLIGEITEIYKGGTKLGYLEAPHLYKRNGYYYLMTAEGGTGYGHAVILARSKNLAGKYIPYPDNPILTAAKKDFNSIGRRNGFLKTEQYNKKASLQKTGHASLVQTQNNEWYIAYLCARPIMPQMRCMLGRETAIQKVIWNKDDWLELANGGKLPELQIPVPDLPTQKFPEEPSKDDFNNNTLNVHFNTLRIPADPSWLSLTERPGFLRLYGQESLFSLNRQSLVARRIQAFNIQAETLIEYNPLRIRQHAGLVAFYNTANYYYLNIYYSESLKCKCLGIKTSDLNKYDELLDERVNIDNFIEIYLRFNIIKSNLQFYYSKNGTYWKKIGPVFDASKLSDEYCHIYSGAFTGAFAGLCVQDLDRHESFADFDYFDYKEI